MNTVTVHPDHCDHPLCTPQEETTDMAQNTSPADDLLGGYSEAALHQAFDLVANKENWKDEIDAVIPTSERDIVAFAVTFFAGCLAETTDLGNGQTRVQAVGYYVAVGA